MILRAIGSILLGGNLVVGELLPADAVGFAGERVVDELLGRVRRADTALLKSPARSAASGTLKNVNRLWSRL